MEYCSRGRKLVALALNLSEVTEVENPSGSRESSPAPSLTEMQALDPIWINNMLLCEDDNSSIGDIQQMPAFSLDPVISDQNTTIYDEFGDYGVDPSSVPETSILPTQYTDSELTTEPHSTASDLNLLGVQNVLPVPLVPYSDTDSEEECQHLVNVAKQQERKRVRNESKWKKNVRKQKRIRGEQYVSCKGKVQEAKTLRPPCKETCRLKCASRITEEMRSYIFDEFWKGDRSWDSKRQFIASCVKTQPVTCSRPRDSSRENVRQKSNVYTFVVNSAEVRVCKVFFLNTLSVTETFMGTALDKTCKVGMTEPDHRGKHVAVNKTCDNLIEQIKQHILKYPSYESHYSRERSRKRYLGSHLNISKMYSLYVEDCKAAGTQPGKQWFFRRVFNEEFNLSFHPPENDTCDLCALYECQLRDASTEEERKTIKDMQDNHIQEGNLRYHLKREDKQKAVLNPEYKTIMADLQKCLPTPYLTNSQSFYLRKLWTFNYTLHDPASKASWCMVWDEVTGGRGANEMASCFFNWAKDSITGSDVEVLNIWTDNCAGQNRNIVMCLMFMWLLNSSPNLKEINHKFLLRGHTHMEVDGEHSIIERAKKHLSRNTIFTCNDWVNFIADCKKKKPFIVKRMNLEDFRNFKSMMDNTAAPFVSRRKNREGENFLISSAVWLQVRREATGILYYKTKFDGEFLTVDLRRNTRKSLQLPSIIPQLRTSKRKISLAKYKDLMTLLQWVPEDYRAYYRDLPHQSSSSMDDESEDSA